MTTAVVPRYRQGTIDNSAWAESLGASERQRSLLAQCLDHLESFSVQVGPTKKDEGESYFEEENIDIVLAAESLRSAAGCLSKITGKGDAGDVEEVLGVVFEKYRGT